VAEKERFASSIVRALEIDPDLRHSTANIRALLFRAALLAEQTGRSHEALADAERALDLLRGSGGVETHTAAGTGGSVLMAQAYRVLADVHESFANYPAAMEALQNMAVRQPALRSKVAKELERLQQRSSAASRRAA
jgi:tetratricopeptide (TPR) repeat protein